LTDAARAAGLNKDESAATAEDGGGEAEAATAE